MPQKTWWEKAPGLRLSSLSICIATNSRLNTSVQMSSVKSPFSDESEDKYPGGSHSGHDALPLNCMQSPPADNYHSLAVYPPGHSEPEHASTVRPITSHAHSVHPYYDPEQAHVESLPDSASFHNSIKKRPWSRLGTESDYEAYEEQNTRNVASRAHLLPDEGGTKVRERFVDRDYRPHCF